MASLTVSLQIVVYCQCLLQLCSSHSNGHPISKLVTGTFAYYDDSNAQSMTLYVCKAPKDTFYWSIIKTVSVANFGNFIIGNGMFSRADIDEHANVITNSQCFFQANNEYDEVSPCHFDVADLCTDNLITLLFTFESEALSFALTKISSRDELIGNEKYAPYQCGVPWSAIGDLSQPEAYPIAFVSEPLPWLPELELRDVEVYTSDDSGCWAYVLPHGDRAELGYGCYFNRDLRWNKALYLQQWTDDLTPEGEPCHVGAQINIRVDTEVMMVGWHCTDGVDTVGDGWLLYKTSEWNMCPIPAVLYY